MSNKIVSSVDYSDYDAYFNGAWIRYDEIKIAPDDRGFELADGVFDIARTFNGIPFVLERHIDRLYRSLKFLRMDSGLTPEQMAVICNEGILRNEHRKSEAGDFTIHPFVTRGKYLDGPPTVCVSIKPIDFLSFAKFYVEGAHGVIARTRSYTSDTVEPKVKHHSRLNMVLATLEAHDIDPEALPILLDQDGNITEGTGNNIFLVKNGVLKTPDDRHILQGVSRDVVMDVAQQLGIPVSVENLQPYDLYTADEVFFTRTSPRIVPVSRVDGRHIGDQIPGPITQQLIAGHSELVGVDLVGQALHYAGLTN